MTALLRVGRSIVAVGVRHQVPDGRDRLIGISAPSRGSCDCDVRRQVGIYTIKRT